MLNLYDTQSGGLKPVQAVDGKTLRFYCCGPTVYGPAHIGNFRTFVLQDVFRRVIELGGQNTKHVRNLTDVDDKTIRDSQKAGMGLSEFTAGWTKKFHGDCTALNCLPPHIEPSAVAHIPEQIAMVRALVDKGYAYPSEDGSVYFRIASYADYGQLSHLDRRELEIGKTANERANADEYEKDAAADYVICKALRAQHINKNKKTTCGEGRPGWHLECSSMIHKYLGDTFDLHSGGVDLVFPHHENEIAQSRCACGGHFARHWFHITHLLVDGGKMSKSLGNMFTLEDLENKGYTPAALRYVLAGGYYRRPLNFTLNSMADATAALERLARAEKTLAAAAGNPKTPSYRELVKMQPALGEFQAAWDSLNDDLNTPEALGHVFSALKRIKPAEMNKEEAQKQWLAFRFILEAFGIILPDLDAQIEIPENIQTIAERRWQARQNKDWAASDTLRDELAALGWAVKDGKDGYQLTKN